jgi:hypothetical protein
MLRALETDLNTVPVDPAGFEPARDRL